MQAPASAQGSASVPQSARPWLWLSIAAVLLALAGNIVALSVGSIYAHLTPYFLPQALAQDTASLVIVSPAWFILAVLALRGSLRAYLVWLGVLAFTVYNYVIYTFSVPFGPLFLLWSAVFGMSLYAIIGGVSVAKHSAVQAAYTSERAVKVIAWALIVIGILFAFVWLSEDVPALLAGKTPQTLIDMGIPTNPVHILDLSFFLPAVFLTGIWLFRRRPLGYTLAPAFIVFLILTGIPILITPLVQVQRRETPAWGAVPIIGTLTAILLVLLIWLMSTLRATTRS